MRGKKSKKLLRMRRRVARLRLEIAQEIGRLNLTERARQRLINAIRAVQNMFGKPNVRSRRQLRSPLKSESSRRPKRTEAKGSRGKEKSYKRSRATNNVGPIEIKRSLQSIVIGEQQTGRPNGSWSKQSAAGRIDCQKVHEPRSAVLDLIQEETSADETPSISLSGGEVISFRHMRRGGSVRQSLAPCRSARTIRFQCT